MLKLLTGAAIVATFCVAAFAQSPAPKTLLEFDPQQMQWLSQAINELPKKIADPFLADLNKQISDREKAKAEAAKNGPPESPAAQVGK